MLNYDGKSPHIYFENESNKLLIFNKEIFSLLSMYEH